jgi:hypothetical protein
LPWYIVSLDKECTMVNEIDATLIYTTGDKLFYDGVQLVPYKPSDRLKTFYECKNPQIPDDAHVFKIAYIQSSALQAELYKAEEYRVSRLVGTVRKILNKWENVILTVEADYYNSKHNILKTTKAVGWDHDLLMALANNALCYKYGDMVIIDGTSPYRQPHCKGMVTVRGYKEYVWIMPYMLYSTIDTLVDSYVERAVTTG